MTAACAASMPKKNRALRRYHPRAFVGLHHHDARRREYELGALVAMPSGRMVVVKIFRHDRNRARDVLVVDGVRAFRWHAGAFETTVGIYKKFRHPAALYHHRPS